MPALPLPQALEFAMQAHRAGRLAEAEAIYRQILAVNPHHADALHLLGIIASQAGSQEIAADLIRRAIAVQPAVADYHSNLGNALKAQGRWEEAIAAHRRAVELRPDLAMIHNNLGNALLDGGRLDEAIAAYRRALQLQPDLALAHNNLGAALKQQGRYDEAIAAYRRTLELQPDLPEAHNNLGTALQSVRRLDEAIAAYRRALALQPEYAMAHNNLGNALFSLRQLDEAIAAYRRALELQPDFALAYNNLGTALKDRGRSDEAIAAYRRALDLQPDFAVAHSNLGNALKDQGQPDEALPCYRHALHLQPESIGIHSNFLTVLHYSPQTTLAGLFDAHCEYDRRHAAPLRAGWQPHRNAPDPDRRLRLGFISPHFASHPVGRFLIRPLEKLDPGQFQIICYSDTPDPDEMTARIRATAAVWHEVAAMSDEQLAGRIQDDGVDILFDLAGHTARGRLPVFARKPAPIQITWLDYVGTTGLSAIDYILADPRQIPSAAERFYREKVLRMPDDYICYDPPASAPPVGPLPALGNGHVTFGSFNILAKITPEVIGVWARILHRIPRARLILKNRGLEEPSTSSRFLGLFAEHGVAPDRVDLLGWSPPDEVLACYNRVDVALDTVPYNGGLTTCEAIWMGVPVVTCPGETFASRHGLTHLSAAGLTETIADNLDEYVELAAALANDLPHLGALRTGLRARVAASPLCDGQRFADHLATLLRDVWRRSCAGTTA